MTELERPANEALAPSPRGIWLVLWLAAFVVVSAVETQVMRLRDYIQLRIWPNS